MLLGKDNLTIKKVLKNIIDFGNEMMEQHKREITNPGLLKHYQKLLECNMYTNILEHAVPIDFKIYNLNSKCSVIYANTIHTYENVKKAIEYEGIFFGCINGEGSQILDLTNYCLEREKMFKKDGDTIFMFSLDYIMSTLHNKYKKINFVLYKGVKK